MNQLFNIKKIASICFICTLLFSCENNVEEVTSQEQEITTNSVVSFSTNVRPIIDNNCIECHRGNLFPDLRSLTIIQANSALIQSQVVTRRMPIGGSLSNQQIAEISDWIDNGALNN